MEEIFRDIAGYENLYMVSNLGRVKSLNYNHTCKEKILKPNKVGGGYLQVGLWNGVKRKNCYVHRLVANAFIENTNNLPFINHKDENKENNSVCNLEWCDRIYNNNFGSRNERAGAALTNHPSFSKPIKCIETGKTYQSIHQAERETGVANQNISKCCLGNRKTAGKLHWKYI